MNLKKDSRRSKVGLRKLAARWRRLILGKPNAVGERQEIRSSGLFDPAWYIEKYPDVAKAGIDPLTHFLTDGAREGRKAGPHFDTRWYVSNYPDAEISGLNPLLHFIRFGQGRIGSLSDLKPQTPEQKADVDLLLASPHFDPAWYGQVNGIGKTHRHAALHYLIFGAARGLAPSQAFDGDRYIKTYPDVRDAGMNPLLHYIRHGESERRLAFPTDAPEEIKLSFDLDPMAEEVVDTIGWRPADTLLEDETFGVLTLGKSPAGLIARSQIATGLPRRLGPAAELFCSLAGRPVEVFASIRRSRRKLYSPADKHSKIDALRGPLEDAWFVSDRRLVLRLSALHGDKPKDHVLRAFQFRPGGNWTTMVGEAKIGPRGGLVTLALENPFQPILCVVCCREGRALDGFVIPFPSLNRGGAHAAEAQLLGRGAQHSHRVRDYGRSLTQELQGWLEARPPVLSEIKVDLTEATGNEAIFTSPARTWLGEMGIHISGGNSDSLDPAVRSYLAAAVRLEPKTLRKGPGLLHLPSDALPSLCAVVSRRLTSGAGSFVACDAEETFRPRLFVSLPAMDDAFAQLQPQGAGRSYPSLSLPDASAEKKPERSALLAIRLTRRQDSTPATLALPIEEQSVSFSLKIGSASASMLPRERITAVVRVTREGNLRPLLRSLMQQTMAKRLNLILAVDHGVDIQADIESMFADAIIMTCEPGESLSGALNRVVETVKSPWILLLDQHVVLHDPRTLATLRELATYKRVATVSCMRIRQAGFRDGAPLTFHSAGIFPARIDFTGSPSVAFETVETAAALPRMTYPVAANGLEFALVSRKAWTELGGLDEEAYPFEGHGLAFCLKASLAGWLHLNTTAISALDTVRRPQERSDVMGSSIFSLSQWGRMLSRATQVRRLDR